MMRAFRCGVMLGAVWCLVVGSAALGAGNVTVRYPDDAKGKTYPLVVKIDADVASGAYTLTPRDGGEAVAAQVFTLGEKGERFLGAVLERARDRHEVRYEMEPASSAKDGVRLNREGDNIRVSLGDDLLTVYHAGEANKPFFYPVIGPTGASFTRAYPIEEVEGEDKDHPHQRSFWFTHGNVNGIDFWASDPKNPPKSNYGTIRETSRAALVEGPAVGVIQTTNDWQGPDGKTLCKDERRFVFYHMNNPRVIDVDVTIHATDEPVTFGDTKEGMFGLRLASSMDVKRKQGGKITTSEGLNDYEAWGKPAAWVDYIGPVQDKTVGVAILNNPESFRYPTHWHVRDYGLFAANPFGYEDFGMKKSGAHTIQPGESITFRYRVILHEGDTQAADIPAAFGAYAHPPRVEVRTD